MNDIVNPPDMPKPSGFAYAVKCHGTMLFLGGATGQDGSGKIRVKGDLLAQFDDSMANICRVVKAAGGAPGDIVKLTYFVINRNEYMAKLKPIGESYRKHLGKHYPAQSLFGVTSLYEEDALIEIEAIACIGDPAGTPLPEETLVPDA